MIYVDFQDVVLPHPEWDEPVWMATGLDLVGLDGAPAEVLATEVWYASQLLRRETKYFSSQFSPKSVKSVLDFLDEVFAVAETREGQPVSVRWWE